MATLILNLGNEAVVLEGALQLFILQVKLTILVLHLLLLEFCQFLQVFILGKKRFGVELVIHQHGCCDGDECHQNANDDEFGVALL